MNVNGRYQRSLIAACILLFPPLRQLWIQPLPRDAMIPRAASFNDDQNRRNGRSNRKGGHPWNDFSHREYGESDKTSGPDQLQPARHANDIAENEKVQHDERNDDSRPKVDACQRCSARRTCDEYENIQRRKSKSGAEFSRCHSPPKKTRGDCRGFFESQICDFKFSST